jgi:hypothetical protein
MRHCDNGRPSRGSSSWVVEGRCANAGSRCAYAHTVPDAFEQELLNDIAEAEALGDYELAAEWRLELKSYRAARQQAIQEDGDRDGSSAVARREALARRRSDRA